MDNRIKRSLKGVPLKINFRTPKKVQEVRDLAISLSDSLEEIEDLDKSNEILMNYYKDSCEIMFDFLQEVPEDFYEYDNFPQGEFEMLQAFFMNPTKGM